MGFAAGVALIPPLALDPQRPLDHFGHQAWGTDSGLPQNTVHSILQTRDGYLWLGTDGGLVRFDGIDFVTFDAEKTPQFKSDTVYDLLQDESGILWISTAAGLLSYRGGVFTAYTTAQGLPADTVWFSHEDRRHRLWAITSAGPAWFDGKVFSPWREPSPRPPQSPRVGGRRAGKALAGRKQRRLRPRYQRLHAATGSHLLSGTRWKRLRSTARRISGSAPARDWSAIPAGTLAPSQRFTARQQVTALHADDDGSMWVGTATGMVHVASEGARASARAKGGETERVDQSVSKTGSTCSGSRPNAGSFASKATSFSPSPPSSALSANRVLAMYEDREGDLWLGTDSAGLHLLRDQKFTTYTTSDGLSGNFVRCVFQSANGELGSAPTGRG